ncbi:MAG: hypothetical protein LBH10_03420 [Burkholderiaceae bacterium]|nr:hypothetical protein [Burkholderiaceae bacterium]
MTIETKPFFSKCAKQLSAPLTFLIKLNFMAEAEKAFNFGLFRISCQSWNQLASNYPMRLFSAGRVYMTEDGADVSDAVRVYHCDQVLAAGISNFARLARRVRLDF